MDTMQPYERIYVALDTNSVQAARRIVDQLKGRVGGFKIGLEFITSQFAQLMKGLGSRGLLVDLQGLFNTIGEDLFWDGKFDDIPNTVGGAAAGLGPLSPKFFNVHVSSGGNYKDDSVEAAVRNKGQSKVLAVTMLTSIDRARCLYLFNREPENMIPDWARYAVSKGVDGLICSGADLGWINSFENLASVPKMTPGIRTSWSDPADQARIMTPSKALAAGATWMVIGRPITNHLDGPAAAVERIVEEIANSEVAI